MGIEVNKYQTQLTDEFISSLKEEERNDLFDMINNVEFIKRLISTNRKYAKDLQRDSKGRILVDLCNPHILENMSYFTESARHFKKFGCYTKLMPNPNPQSEYMQWLKREVSRCWDGMVRESDGEWITGDMYFYLNYFPIIQAKTIKGTKRADRIVDFPRMWEGVYWRFHYMDQAINGGIYDDFKGAKHGCEIAKRGASKSYSLAAVLAKMFILGKHQFARKKIKSLVVAYGKEFLTKDAIINKFIDGINHCAENTQFPSKRLKESMSEMTWQSGFIDKDTGRPKGSLNEVLAVAIKDDPDKPRGKRSDRMFYEEFGCHLKGTKVLSYDCSEVNVENVKIGDKLMGNDGSPRLVKSVYTGFDMMYKITLSNGDFQIVNSKHPVYFKKYNWEKKTYSEHTLTAPELLNKNGLNKGYYIPKATLKFDKKDVKIHPYLLGLWLGDGDSSRIDISNEDTEVLTWLSSNYNGIIQDLNQSNTCKNFHISKKTNSQIFDDFIFYDLLNNKHIPNDYKINESSIQLDLVAGLIDTDGTYHKKNYFEITQRYDRKHILDSVKFMCESNGLKCKIDSRISTGKKPGVLHYRLRISGDLSIIPTKIARKKGFKNTSYRSKNDWSNYTFKVEEYGLGEYFGFLIDGNHLFLLNDLTISHNTFPKFLDVWQTCLPNVQIEDIASGMAYAIGTGGTPGSDFNGALEMLMHPDGYNVYSLPNFWDKGANGQKRTIFFFPGYINSGDYYNEDGVSDVIAALTSEIKHRINLKYNSSDPLQLTRRKAETAFTIQDAIMKRDGSLYPTDKLNDVINEINLNPKYTDDMWVGRLSLSKSGEVEYKPDNDLKYITEFPHKDNKIAGAICIKHMPVKNSSGSVPWGRYIAGADVYDDDSSDTLSLFSLFIHDLWTDELVFEYTGRPMFADDAYENARLALLMYNAECNYENNKKGFFAYMSKHNCLYLLSDTLDYLKDKEIVKKNTFGNNSKGTGNYGQVGAYGRRCYRDYLLRSTPQINLKEVDGQTVEDVINVFNYQKIWSKGLLQETAMWTPDGNYDRHDAIIMLMLLREDKLRLLGDTSPRDAGQNRDVNYLGKDKFFENNYRKNDLTKYKLKF